MKRLFVIGDSISIHHGPYLKKILRDRYHYDRKRGAEEALADLKKMSKNIIKGLNLELPERLSSPLAAGSVHPHSSKKCAAYRYLPQHGSFQLSGRSQGMSCLSEYPQILG